MGTPSTLNVIIKAASACLWGTILAGASWIILQRFVETLVNRAARKPKNHATIVWSVLGLGKWILFAGWLYIGLVFLHLPALWTTLGFTIAWFAGMVFFIRMPRPHPYSPMIPHDSSQESHHGAI